MNNKYLLSTETGRELYETVRNLPIIDYHCHLSPLEIYEDKEFTNIGQVMLGGDHYKWRVMRAAGINEDLITGTASWHDKFMAYAGALELAAFNPVAQWTRMELSAFFGIDRILDPDSAEDIWREANRVIAERHLSPRKVMEMSNVEYIATTDDPVDDLRYHKLIADDKSFNITVKPAFRTDRALNLNLTGYPEYIKSFSDAAGIPINNISDFKAALSKRLDYFTQNGCRFSDIGLETFPDRIGSEIEAGAAFNAALAGNPAQDELYKAFLGNMYVYLAGEYASRGLIMQWHLAVLRNSNQTLFKDVGADAGGDCINDMIPAADIIRILNAANSTGKLPQTILYTLNPGMMATLSGIAGSFRNVIVGAAWWFCDHKRGIRELCTSVAETGYLGSFLGMLTDSRSFLSYPRHDYFRRIFCDLIGEWVEADELQIKAAKKLCRLIAHDNIAEIIK